LDAKEAILLQQLSNLKGKNSTVIDIWPVDHIKRSDSSMKQFSLHHSPRFMFHYFVPVFKDFSLIGGDAVDGSEIRLTTQHV